MPSRATWLVRRLRYGRAIVVVSGLPRSGTSMAMKMLEAGGMPILADDLRKPDESNPKGYLEFEKVKQLEGGRDTSWLPDARGKAVKIISFLLTWLPETYEYKVIFMRRNLTEIIASQQAMLLRRGEPSGPAQDGDRLRAIYETHLEQVSRFLSNRACFSTLLIDYTDVLSRPSNEAERIRGFLGSALDVDRMAAVASPDLYRNRHTS